MSSSNTLTIKLPYPFRHLVPEIKARGGRFDSTSKTWSLVDNLANRALTDQIKTPALARTAVPEERVRNVANVAVELLNELRIGHFTLCEAAADRVVIEQIKSA